MEANEVKVVNERLAVLMGWPVEEVVYGVGPKSKPPYIAKLPDGSLVLRVSEGDAGLITWNPYHSIAQALGDGGPGTVVGAMKAPDRGYRLQLFQGAESTLWFAVFFKGTEKVSEEFAETPAAALTLAACEALKAEKGTPKEEGNE